MNGRAVRTVLIFAKPPVMGLAKTRLARALESPAEARRIACACTALTLRAATDPRWMTRLHLAPDVWLTRRLPLFPPHLPRHTQGRGDLGERLKVGVTAAPCGDVILLGTDTPGLTTALIWQAFRALRRHDAVFGPARDGGFWLMGLRRGHRPPDVFNPVRWSSAHTLADITANLGPRARIHHLPTLIDIHTATDWRDWQTLRRAR